MKKTTNNHSQDAADSSCQQPGRRLPIYEAAMELAPIVGEHAGLMKVHIELAAKAGKLSVYRLGSYVKHPPGFEVKGLTDEVYWDDVMRWLPTWLKEYAPRLSVELPGIQDGAPTEEDESTKPLSLKRLQELIVLDAIHVLGYAPMGLPPIEKNGQGGVKAKVREMVIKDRNFLRDMKEKYGQEEKFSEVKFSKHIVDHTWRRLKDFGEIQFATI